MLQPLAHTKLMIEDLMRAIQGSIHCYDTQSGDQLSCWPNISPQPLTSFIIMDQHDLLITCASLDSHATAWKVHPDTGQISKLRDCAPSAGMLTSLVASTCQSMMMTCSMDGTLALWSLQTFDLLFSTRMAKAPRCAALHPGELISVAVGSQVSAGGLSGCCNLQQAATGAVNMAGMYLHGGYVPTDACHRLATAAALCLQFFDCGLVCQERHRLQ